MPRRCIVALALALCAAACVSCVRIGPRPSTATILVASNRQKLDARRPLDLLLGVERGAELTFHRCQLSLPDVQRRDGQYPAMLLGAGRERIKLRPEPDMPVQAFEQSLAGGAPTTQPGEPEDEQELLVYVHGYAATPHEAIIEAGQFAHDVNFDQPVVVFTWPTRELYLSYLVDGINAEWSVPDFVSLLELIQRAGAHRVHVVGHSMGARIVMRGVKEFVARRCALLGDEQPVSESPPQSDGTFFGQIVLVAPDEDTEVFERSFAPLLAQVAARTTIYFSTRDRALGLAYSIFGYKRLGMGDCPQLSPALLERIQSIDVTRVDPGFFGHFYHLDSPEVLMDIRRVLANQSPTDPQRCEKCKNYYRLLPGGPASSAAPDAQ
jgi:esterase/lipase superfamily enzyme